MRSHTRKTAFVVEDSCSWRVHWGGCNSSGGIEGMLTKCRLYDGQVFYVRENAKRAHFETSSNARIGLKRGEVSGSVNVLELCCPSDRFDEVSSLVKKADGLKRPVHRNRNFTSAWAEQQFKPNGAKPNATSQ